MAAGKLPPPESGSPDTSVSHFRPGRVNRWPLVDILRWCFAAAFWRAVIERALKSFAQGLLAVFTADGTGPLDTDWTGALSTAGMVTLSLS